MKLFKQMTGQKLAAPDEVVVQPNAQYQADEAQKCRELQGCTLADFEQRVTLGARPLPFISEGLCSCSKPRQAAH
jgi:hypothetical protein